MTNIGFRIKELRRGKGVTQEQFAAALGLTGQAVSKWESGVGCPDISLVPVIAGYFRVSIDELFDYDVTNLDERIETIIRHADRVGFAEGERELLDATNDYPGSEKLKAALLSKYESKIRQGATWLEKRALALGEQLLSQTTDQTIAAGAKADLASIHMASGEAEEAEQLIMSLPYIYDTDINDRMRCAASILRGKKRLEGARGLKPWAHQALFVCCENEARGFFETGDFENALESFTEAAAVVELFIRREERDRSIPEKYRMISGRDAQCRYEIWRAACLSRLGRGDESEAAIEKARELATGSSFFDEALREAGIWDNYHNS